MAGRPGSASGRGDPAKHGGLSTRTYCRLPLLPPPGPRSCATATRAQPGRAPPLPSQPRPPPLSSPRPPPLRASGLADSSHWPRPPRASAWRRTVTAGVHWQSAKSEALGQVLPDSLWVSTTRDLGESLRSPHSVSFPGVPHPSLIPLNTSRAGCTRKDELGLLSLGGETQTELEAIRWQ